MRRGDLETVKSGIEEMRRTHGDAPYLIELEIQMALLRGDKANALRLLQNSNDDDYTENMQYLRALRAILEGDIKSAEAFIKKIESSSLMQERYLITVFYESGDKERLSAVVNRMDGYEFGAVLLSIEVAYSSSRIKFDLDDTPNFKARLEEAQIDLSKFITAQ